MGDLTTDGPCSRGLGVALFLSRPGPLETAQAEVNRHYAWGAELQEKL